MNLEIWHQLVQGKPLQSLNALQLNGRIDLRGLHIADPHVTKKIKTKIADVEILGGLTTIRKSNWRAIDFSSSQLSGLRLFGCNIDDCVFDECRFGDLRVWGSDFKDVSFRHANLRGAVLGGVVEGRWNKFHNVDFSFADLRGTNYEAAEFVGCTFKSTKLDNVDFESTTFTDCCFEGELREVLFYRHGFRGESYPPNEMKRVDLSRAKLRWSEFRGLDLDEVRFPEGEDHLVVRNFPQLLETLISILKEKSDLGSKALAAVLAHKRKWLGSKQNMGVFNKDDLLETAGDEGLDLVQKTIIEGDYSFAFDEKSASGHPGPRQ
jgi:hypothetical protein